MLFGPRCAQFEYRHGMIVKQPCSCVSHVFLLLNTGVALIVVNILWFCNVGADCHPVVTLHWSFENTSISLSDCFGVDSMRTPGLYLIFTQQSRAIRTRGPLQQEFKLSFFFTDFEKSSHQFLLTPLSD